MKLLTKDLSWTLQVTLSFLRLLFLMLFFMTETETNQTLKFSFLWDMAPGHWIIGSRLLEKTRWSDLLQTKRPSCESLRFRISNFLCNFNKKNIYVIYVLFGFYIRLNICFSSFFLSNCDFCVYLFLI